MIQITFAPTFDDWQRVARRALQDGIAPEAVIWQELAADQPSLDIFTEAEAQPAAVTRAPVRVPRAFVELARAASLNREATRWALLYRLLWRLTHGESKLLEISVDPDVSFAVELQKSVRRDIHKMRE
ncbi:MAG TPA: hypothetical protein VK993_01625, partial [Chthoniobacterales bacterium]|nr:hypothetical protein [Chthoniobacterales bacterium]